MGVAVKLEGCGVEHNDDLDLALLDHASGSNIILMRFKLIAMLSIKHANWWKSRLVWEG